jgi:hypothetical protein
MNVIENLLILMLIYLIYKTFNKPQIKYDPAIIHPASL